LLLAHPALAADAAIPLERPRHEDGGRQLNGHVFIPSRLARGPFSTTSVGLMTLLGYASADGPTYNLQGVQTGIRSYDVAAVGQGLDLDLALSRMFALRLSAVGSIYSGITGSAALNVGATALYEFQAGGLAGKTFGSWRLAAIFDASYRPNLSLLVGSALATAVLTRSLAGVSVLSSTNRLRLAPGLSAAWAPGPVFGLVGEARYLWDKRATGAGQQTDVLGGIGLGLVADLDFDPLIRWPIGLLAVYSRELGIGGSGVADMQQVGGGVFYTRRKSLVLGLEVVARTGELRPSVRPTLSSSAALATVRLRYYW
jgi:hypothetical protein